MLVDLLSLPLDQTLTLWVSTYGAWALALIAAIVFAETGLVITPFLPGDSLLFISGAVLAVAGHNVHAAALVLALAAIAGDATNFAVGRFAGPRVMRRFGGRWLRPAHLEATRGYFARFGGATIVIARFVPIVRTLAPFLAGVGDMSYRRFAMFNVVGAIAWVGLLIYAGAYFGSIPLVRDNLSIVSLSIVIVSAVPVVIAVIRGRRGQSA
jgi:membrane-associated protein